MIINNKNNEVEIETFGEILDSNKASIDGDSLPFLLDLLSTSFYSNPIGSIVREITSNCFDAHIAAGKKEPVIIKNHTIENNRYISFIDFGTGLSPKQMSSVYNVYLKSTKTNSNDYIGAFGLGSKSPLSYTSIYYIITIVDGIEYFYSYSKSDGIPDLDLLDTRETVADNGTEIRIPVSDYRDYIDFVTEIKNQLLYFDDVFTINFDSIDNDYKILVRDNFKFRENKNITSMHICLGKVYYPIDWSVLKINEILIPVGLKFEIGDLTITRNRESIKYEKETVEKIIEKIRLTIEELNKLSSVIVIDSLKNLYEIYKRKDIIILKIQDFNISVQTSKINLTKNVLNDLVKISNTYYEESFIVKIPFYTLKGFEHIDINLYNLNILDLFKYLYIEYKDINKKTNSFVNSKKPLNFNELEKYILYDSDKPSKVRNYKLNTINKNLLIKKTNLKISYDFLRKLKSYLGIEIKKKVLFIKSPALEYKKLKDACIKYIENNVTSYNSIKILEEDLINYNFLYKNNINSYESIKVNLRTNTNFETYDYKNLNIKKGELVIYGAVEDKKLLLNVHSLISKKHVYILEVAKKNFNYLKNKSNHYFVEDFLKSTNKNYRNLATNLVVQKEIDKRVFKKGIPDIYLKLLNDRDYLKYQNNSELLKIEKKNVDEDFLEMLLEYFETKNLVDKNILEKVKNLLKFEEKFLLLKLIDERLVNKSYQREIIKYLKSNGIKFTELKLTPEQKSNNLNNLKIKIYGYSKITKR